MKPCRSRALTLSQSKAPTGQGGDGGGLGKKSERLFVRENRRGGRLGRQKRREIRDGTGFMNKNAEPRQLRRMGECGGVEGGYFDHFLSQN